MAPFLRQEHRGAVAEARNPLGFPQQLFGEGATGGSERQVDAPRVERVPPPRLQIHNVTMGPQELAAIEIGSAIDENFHLRPLIEDVPAPDELVEDPALHPGLARGRHRPDGEPYRD